MTEARIPAPQVLAHMDHPNVVKYYSAYAEEREMIIVMEYCEVQPSPPPHTPGPLAGRGVPCLGLPRSVWVFQPYSHIPHTVQEGDLTKFLKMRKGRLLEEHQIMLRFVQARPVPSPAIDLHGHAAAGRALISSGCP